MHHFSDEQTERSIAGAVDSRWFNELDTSRLVEPICFFHEPWDTIYRAAYALRQAGKPVCLESINFMLESTGHHKNVTTAFFGNTGIGDWHNWKELTDEVYAWAPSPYPLLNAMEDLRRYWVNRESHRLGKCLTEGAIGIAEACALLNALASSNGTIPKAMLSKKLYRAQDPVPELNPTYSLLGQPICTPGNLSVLNAHIKSGKSAVFGAALAAATGLPGDCLGLSSANPLEHAVVHIDTEQSERDWRRMIKRSLARVGLEEEPPWLKSYHLLNVPQKDLMPVLEQALKDAKREHGGIHSVILDGSADFVVNVNDMNESAAFISKQQELIAAYDTIIWNAIHLNPGDKEFALKGVGRGHLGSQLARKAESNIAVTKDAANKFTLFTENSRHAHITQLDGQQFYWDEFEEMHRSIVATARETKARTKEAHDIERLSFFAKQALNHRKTTAMAYGDFIEAIEKSARKSTRSAENYFSAMRKLNIIKQNALDEWELK
jgi:AAA domain